MHPGLTVRTLGKFVVTLDDAEGPRRVDFGRAWALKELLMVAVSRLTLDPCRLDPRVDRQEVIQSIREVTKRPPSAQRHAPNSSVDFPHAKREALYELANRHLVGDGGYRYVHYCQDIIMFCVPGCAKRATEVHEPSMDDSFQEGEWLDVWKYVRQLNKAGSDPTACYAALALGWQQEYLPDGSYVGTIAARQTLLKKEWRKLLLATAAQDPGGQRGADGQLESYLLGVIHADPEDTAALQCLITYYGINQQLERAKEEYDQYVESQLNTGNFDVFPPLARTYKQVMGELYVPHDVVEAVTPVVTWFGWAEKEYRSSAGGEQAERILKKLLQKAGPSVARLAELTDGD